MTGKIMNTIFQQYHSLIKNTLESFFYKKSKELSVVNQWGADLMNRLREFSLQGKLIRGSLLILSYQMFKKETPGWILRIASALELVHSSLLIHDDIMDRDTLRRGQKTIFYQYKELGDMQGSHDSYHLGESFGICSGDIGFFLAYEILSDLNLDPRSKKNILLLWSQELVSVGLAQMQDIYLSTPKAFAGEEDIIELYRLKTARYTYSLPLMTGALAASQNQNTIHKLEKIGENFGIIFQIKDDEIDLFGTESNTGKPVGTDIKENKRTLLSLYLSELVRNGDRDSLRAIYNRMELSSSDIAQIKEIAERSGVLEKLHQKILDIKKKTEILISSLDIEEGFKNSLHQIILYNIERTS
jgi:geranylgeranyl diphosphate synthase type I